MQQESDLGREFERDWIETALRDPGVWRKLVDHYAADVWRLCRRVCAEEECDALFVECWKALRANEGALLRRFDGRSSLRTYLQQTIVDLLASRLRELLKTDPKQGWEAFERFFHREICQMIFRVAGSPQQLQALGFSAEDVYQDVALDLAADGFRRLRAYDGRGSLTAFVRRVVRNLCLDWSRKQEGRRRLPAAIARLGHHEQQVYRWMFWEGYSAPEAEALLCRHVQEGEAKETVRRVQNVAGPVVLSEREHRRRVSLQDQQQLPASDASSPEKILIDGERVAQRERLLECMRGIVATLSADQQLYIRFRFHQEPPLPPQEIAVLLGITRSEVYRIRQHIICRMREELPRSGFDLQKIGELLG